jgi:hypothetical protein
MIYIYIKAKLPNNYEEQMKHHIRKLKIKQITIPEEDALILTSGLHSDHSVVSGKYIFKCNGRGQRFK